MRLCLTGEKEEGHGGAATQVCMEVQGASAKGGLQWPVLMTAVFLDWPFRAGCQPGVRRLPTGLVVLEAPCLDNGLRSLNDCVSGSGNRPALLLLYTAPPAPLLSASEVCAGAQWAWEWMQNLL